MSDVVSAITPESCPLPPEIWANIVRFLPNISGFFAVLSLNKAIKSFIEMEDPECGGHLLFTLRCELSQPSGSEEVGDESSNSDVDGSDADATDKLEVGVVLPRRGHLASNYQLVVPKTVPRRQLATLASIYPQIRALSPRDFPRFPPSEEEESSSDDEEDEDELLFGGFVLDGSSSGLKETTRRQYDDAPAPSVVYPYVRRLRSRHRIETGAEFRRLLAQFPNLRSAEFHNVIECGAEEFAVLTKPLLSLDLEHCGISDADFASPILSSLRTLRLRASGESGALTIGLLAHLPKLEKLEVEGIVRTFMWTTEEIPSNHPLRKLVLSNTTVHIRRSRPKATPGRGVPRGRGISILGGGSLSSGSLSNGEFAVFKSLETLIVSRVSSVGDGAFRGVSDRLRKLIVHLCKGVTKQGVEAACGPTVVAQLDEFVVNPFPRIRHGRAGRVRGPSQYQRKMARKADKKRVEELQKVFQLKHMLGGGRW